MMPMEDYKSRVNELLKQKDAEMSHLWVYCDDLKEEIKKLQEILKLQEEDKPYGCEAIYIKKELYSFLKDVAMIDASKPEDIVVDLIYEYLQDKMFYED